MAKKKVIDLAARRAKRAGMPSFGDRYFILKGRRTQPATLNQWMEWFATEDRKIAHTKIRRGVEVSTIFLGLDHNWSLGGPPILFETMIFGGPHDGWQCRYASYDQAEIGHTQAVELARETK